MLVLVAVLHLVKIIAVLDWKHSAGPLMGNGFAVAGDFYNIDRNKVTGRMCDANVKTSLHVGDSV